MITWNNAIVAKQFNMTVQDMLDWSQDMQPSYKVMVEEDTNPDDGEAMDFIKVLYTDGDDGMMLFSENGCDNEVQIEMSSCHVEIAPKFMIKIMKEFK